MVRQIATLACALAIACFPVAAADEMVTDRPDVTESARVVPSGAWQIESGVSFSSDDEVIEVDVTQLFGTLARIGLTERLELRIGFDGFIDIEAGPSNVDGAGDTGVGVKFALADERDGRPESALIVGTKLPTGDDAIGSPRADPFAIAAFSNTLSETVSVGYNLGLAASSFETFGGREETDVVASASVSFGLSISETVGLFAEAFGSAIVSDGKDNPVAVNGGVTWGLHPDVQLDAFVGFGISNDAPDQFIGLGLSLRGGR